MSLTSRIPAISSSFLMTSLLILSSLVYPVTLHRKRISAASRLVMSLFLVTHVSLPFSNDGLTTNKTGSPTLKERTTPDSRNTPSTTNLKEEEIVDAPGNGGNTSMPEKVKRPNPWRKIMMMMMMMILLMHAPFLSCLLNLGSSLNST